MCIRDRQRCQCELPSTFLYCLGPQRCRADFGLYNTKMQSPTRHLCRKSLPRSRGLPQPRILNRFLWKVGLQSGGTWFSSGTEQCPRQIGSSRRYRPLCMNRFLPVRQTIELRNTDEGENHLDLTNHRRTQPAMSIETDRAAWKATAFYTATCLPDNCCYNFSWEFRGHEGKSRRGSTSK